MKTADLSPSVPANHALAGIDRPHRMPDAGAGRSADEVLFLLGHELRNPVHALCAALDVLDAAAPASDSACEAQAVVARQGRRLAHLVQVLLDCGRVLTGRSPMAQHPVDLAATVGRVARALQHDGSVSAGALQLQLAPAWVQGDAQRLEQALQGLLAGAVERAGGLVVQVRLRSRGDTTLLELRAVRDTVQVPPVTEAAAPAPWTNDGAGSHPLGELLTERLLELHGGQLAVDGEGPSMRLTATLPACKPPPARAPERAGSGARSVLVVAPEGHVALRHLRHSLERDGHGVSHCADGIDGLLQVLRSQPDVAVLALGLLGLRGEEVAQHARACGYAGRLVALPAPGTAVDRQALMQAGFDDCLSWPLDAATVTAVVAC